MNAPLLRLGRIGYLNVQPFFAALEESAPAGQALSYHQGHPAELNRALQTGTLDLSPSSSFEYLQHAEHYALLPHASVSAQGSVQSVLLVSPVPLNDLGRENEVLLTTSSASSVALLKILWQYAWNLPQPKWGTIAPGQGIAYGKPFLEIGDAALRLFLAPPQGWYIYDLAEAWHTFTGLPFVFALWIVRRDLEPPQRKALRHVAQIIGGVSNNWPGPLETLLQSTSRPDWLSSGALRAYWNNLVPCLGPREQAGLLLFAKYATELGLLSGAPGLSWALPAEEALPQQPA